MQCSADQGFPQDNQSYNAHGAFNALEAYSGSLKACSVSPVGLKPGNCNNIELTQPTSTDTGSIVSLHANQRELYRLHKIQKRVTTSASVARCCNHPIPLSKPTIVEHSGGYVGLEGVARCRNQHCVYCQRARAQEAAGRLTKIMRGAEKLSREVLFLTVGLNNRGSGQDIKKYYKDLMRVWARVFDTRACKALGIGAWIRSLDFTVKASFDINLHLHCLLVLDDDRVLSSDDVKALYQRIYARWSEYARRAGHATSYSGNDLQRVNSSGAVGRYLSKAFNVLELVSRNKTSLTSYTIPDLLALIDAEPENGRWLQVYRAVEIGLKGARSLAFSKGAKALEALAEEDVSGDEDNASSDDQVRTSIALPLWYAFSRIKYVLLLAFTLKGRARAYFCELAAMFQELPAEDLEDEDLQEHLDIFLRLYDLDLRLNKII